MQQDQNIGNDYQCINKDGQADYIVFNLKVGKDPKILCKECFNKKSQENEKHMTFEKGMEEASQKLNKAQDQIKSQIENLQKLLDSTQDFRSQILNFFDFFIINLKNWIESLSYLNNNSNIQKELSYLTEQISSHEKQLQQLNFVYITKLCNHLKEYNLVYQKQDKFQILLKNLMKKTQTMVLEQNIELKINQQVLQQDCCMNITVNSLNSLMISTEKNDILTWTFDQGKMNKQQHLIKHKNWVNCIVYSKQKEVFFSGSDDNTIIIWNLQNNQWKYSQPFEKHQVNCLILNQQEDKLFSGGNNCQIVIWNVNLENNELIYGYELNKHKSSIFSMSLNQSENTLVSCAHEIIVWEKGQDNQMRFKYIVKQDSSQYYFGKKLFFISESCFIWVTANQEVDKIFVFEMKNGVFRENLEKTIELSQDKENEDMFLFPIIKEKKSSIIIVRHKTHIYLIRDLGSGKLEMLQKINCQTTHIYGTITNNLSHLLFWDNKTKGYQIYEIKLNERYALDDFKKTVIVKL